MPGQFKGKFECKEIIYQNIEHFDVFVYILNKGWVQKIERFDWEIPY